MKHKIIEFICKMIGPESCHLETCNGLERLVSRYKDRKFDFEVRMVEGVIQIIVHILEPHGKFILSTPIENAKPKDIWDWIEPYYYSINGSILPRLEEYLKSVCEELNFPDHNIRSRFPYVLNYWISGHLEKDSGTWSESILSKFKVSYKERELDIGIKTTFFNDGSVGRKYLILGCNFEPNFVLYRYVPSTFNDYNISFIEEDIKKALIT